jgi:membrane protease YdiL (CAAX protease family)
MTGELRSALLRVLPFAVVLVFLLLRIKKGKLQVEGLYLNPPPSRGQFWLWTFGFLIFVLLIELLLNTLGILEVSHWHHPWYSSLIRIFGAVILAPLTEELVFRGIILGMLARKMNLHLAIFLQAVFFVLLHGFTYESSLNSNIGIVQGFVDASLYAYAKYHTRSLYTPMAMHMTGNIVATAERFIF